MDQATSRTFGGVVSNLGSVLAHLDSLGSHVVPLTLDGLLVKYETHTAQSCWEGDVVGCRWGGLRRREALLWNGLCVGFVCMT